MMCVHGLSGGRKFCTIFCHCIVFHNSSSKHLSMYFSFYVVQTNHVVINTSITTITIHFKPICWLPCNFWWTQNKATVIVGSACPFSHLLIVETATPISIANASWDNLAFNLYLLKGEFVSCTISLLGLFILNILNYKFKLELQIQTGIKNA